MQESRLFKIVYHLLDKGRATASESAEKFEVSVRTIYRDVDALSEAGIPVYAETGRSGGIHLMHNFVLDKAVLSEEEKQEILTALQSMSFMKNTDSSQTLQKLSAIFHLRSENWLEVDFSRWGNKGTDNEKFELLKSAIIQQKCIKITYANSYLYEWHQLLLNWVHSNQNGDNQPFIPKPYNWKTYGDMNMEFFRKHQSTPLEAAKCMLRESHTEVMELAKTFSNEELFTKGVYKWVGGSTLGSYFVSVTASHYDWAIKKLKAHKKNCADR